MQENNGRQRRAAGNAPCKAVFSTLWHLPDSFHWMEPLPNMHRRGVLIAALIMLIAFLWPTEERVSDTPVQQMRNTTLPTQGGPTEPTRAASPAENVTPRQAESNAPPQQPFSQPERIADNPSAPDVEPTQSPASQEQPSVAENTATTEVWKEFTIQRGHTLTQIFRDNRLIVNDAFLLAQVEGPGKPVNALRIGQKVRIRIAEGNQVTGLEVELTPTQSALFTRQSNGRFLRVH